MAKLSNSPLEASVLQLEARKSFAFDVELVEPNGAPVDLSGSTVTLTVGSYPEPNVPPVVVVERAGVIDAAAGRARIALQAAELDLDAAAYPFVIVLRSGGYSLVIVKGEAQVQENPELGAVGHVYAGGEPVDALQVRLRGAQVIRVTSLSGRPGGAGAGLDAAGVPAGDRPTALGDGTWEWRPVVPQVPQVPADWTATDGPAQILNKPSLDFLAGATFTDSPTVKWTVTGDNPTGLAVAAATAETFDTELGANVDLNSFTAPATYWQSQNAEASLALNYPEAMAGRLEVRTNYNAAEIVQTYTTFRIGGADGRQWMRSCYNGNWSRWTCTAGSDLYTATITTDWLLDTGSWSRFGTVQIVGQMAILHGGFIRTVAARSMTASAEYTFGQLAVGSYPQRNELRPTNDGLLGGSIRLGTTGRLFYVPTSAQSMTANQLLAIPTIAYPIA